MLTFVGLGLYDERSITLAGREAVRAADRVFAERYTSRLGGATIEDLEAAHGITVEVRDRAGIERDPGEILSAAADGEAAVLTAGDTMMATTHVDLRLRAIDRGIETRLVHGVTARTAAVGLTGLQNYRFGRATTLPFPDGHGADGLPGSVTGAIDGNRERGLHTLVYLDIRAERSEYMTADVAADLLAERYPAVLAVAVARAGSPSPRVEAAPMAELAGRSFGTPLHLLVVPGVCHPVEAEALEALAGADPAEIETV